MKKILAFTAIRSEYDLLSYLYKYLHQENDIELKLIVSGAHLSEEYGYSVNDIESDGLDILAKIETLTKTGTKVSRVKSAAKLMMEAIDIVDLYNPDLIIFGGDREEVIVAAIIGGYLEIPTMHFFGGDHVEDSHIDNPVRHATSKLSTVHMASTKEHAQRLMDMGEASERVFNIGSAALDKFKLEKTLSRLKIKKYFKIKKNFDNFGVLIFHPIPEERDVTANIFENILNALNELNINMFVSYPNIDPGNDEIISVIQRYKDNTNFCFYKNLPRNIFLSIYKNSNFIIGNSSSGIVESASIPIAAINVGFRQSGRKTNKNVVFCGIEKGEIMEAVKLCRGKKFQENISMMTNIYGDGASSLRALEIIKKNDFRDMVFKNEDALR
jgi:UDP-hydrolysing UDP-N-acetyl-D-glucosamine 2-epimerase